MALHEVRAVNMVMTGAASHFLPLPEGAYLEALKSRLPARVVEVNAQAFRAGRALVHPAGERG
jgi:indolepyruvate ferredoxin oxidoreductase beta subunit